MDSPLLDRMGGRYATRLSHGFAVLDRMGLPAVGLSRDFVALGSNL